MSLAVSAATSREPPAFFFTELLPLSLMVSLPFVVGTLVVVSLLTLICEAPAGDSPVGMVKVLFWK